MTFWFYKNEVSCTVESATLRKTQENGPQKMCESARPAVAMVQHTRLKNKGYRFQPRPALFHVHS